MWIHWLTAEDLIPIHDEIIATTGGDPGGLDMGALESTVKRPQNLHHYEQEADLSKLAATLGYGLTKNHCFLDGNKRIALIGIYTFLAINGLELNASEVDAANFFLDLAASTQPPDVDIKRLAKWIDDNL